MLSGWSFTLCAYILLSGTNAHIAGARAGAVQSCALLLVTTQESGQAGSVPTLQLSIV